MSVIALHCAVAQEKIGSDRAAAEIALDRIRDASSDAPGDLRWVVRVLRDDIVTDRAQVPTVSSIPELAEVTHGAGVTVSTSIDCPADVPPPVDAARPAGSPPTRS